MYSVILTSMTSRTTSPAKSSLEHVPAVLLPSDPNMYWHLTEGEIDLISQLTEAYTMTQSGQTYVKLSPSNLCTQQVLSAVGHMAADMLAFFSSVPDFVTLPVSDQAAVLSANAMTIFLIRNSFAASYDADDLGVTGACPVSQHEELAQKLCQFQRSLRPILRNDVSTAAILQCTVVFDNCAPDLFDRQPVSMLHDKYVILLKHYVESQCSYLFSWNYLEAMWDLVNECKDLAAQVTQQFEGWSAIINPLIHKLTKPIVDQS